MDRIGLIGALVGLRDLKRARRLWGRPPSRKKIQLCGATRMIASGRMPLHDGAVGEITAANLMREATAAREFLVEAFRLFREDHPLQAMKLYFLAAMIATNVIFASRIHGIKLPERVNAEMDTVITEAMRGIKRVAAGRVRKAITKGYRW